MDKLSKFKSTELCPHCGTEQPVTTVVQECPNCKEPLVACTMCIVPITKGKSCNGCGYGTKFECGEIIEKGEYHIEVCRIGYGHKTISVTASSHEEAEQLALDEAGSYEFSEHTSEYVIPDSSQEKTYTESELFEIANKHKWDTTICDDETPRTIQVALENEEDYFGEFVKIEEDKYRFNLYKI